MNLLTKANSYRTVLISLFVMIIFLSLTHFNLLPQMIDLKNVAAITFLMIVIYAAFRDGFIHGLISTLIAEGYFLYTYSIPGQPFHYTQENIWRLIVIGFALSSLTYLLGKINSHIAAEKTAREKAEKIAEQLQESGLQKEQFISIASHELKTPITSLKLLTHMLQKKAAEEKNEQTALYIKRIDNQVNNLINLTTNLLDASRMANGKLKMRMEFFDINQLLSDKIEEIANMNETHRIVRKGKIKQTIMGDKNYLSQVIVNLLTNAVRYSPEGSRIIVSAKGHKDKLTLSVQDSGIGISKEHQKKIFEQFYQVNNTMSNRGLGIGLFISSKIIKEHGGKISVKSQPNKGSTFTITLPIRN